MKTALIVSLNFNPGHVSHLVASYKQCQEIGYSPILYINKTFRTFIPEGLECVIYGEKYPEKADIAVFLFPSEKNIGEIWRLKRKYKCRIIYIFHEPLEALSVYRKAGFSIIKLFKLSIINVVSAITVRLSDAIILPSYKALELYNANKLYKNLNRTYLPLMYDDECKAEYLTTERSYFSYIGTIASDHSYNEFFNFITWAIGQERLNPLQFLIATKSYVERTPQVMKLLASGRLTLIDGQPLTDKQINKCYSSSYVVWNAYQRTTQSGVLAKSFMFGTPAIVLRKNLSEFTVDNQEVVAIDDNRSPEQIEQAIRTILNDFPAYSGRCRQRFLNSFYYRNYNETFSRIIKKQL